jgi:hypothetical protein
VAYPAVMDDPPQSPLAGGRPLSASPVLRLSEDVLLAIFLECLPDIAFSHICHAWREIALEARSLWSYLDFSGTSISAERTREYIRRAGDAPLSIHLSEEQMTRSRDSLNALAALYVVKMPVICSLSLELRNLSRAEGFLRLHGPAHALDTLHLSIGYDAAFEDANDLDSSNERHRLLSDTLFGGYAPRLRSLVLSTHLISPSWPPYHNVRSLNLKCLSPAGFRTATVLMILAATPLLEYLWVSDVRGTVDDEPVVPATGETIELPYLRFIQLCHEEVSGLAPLLSRIRFPSVDNIQIFITWRSRGPSALPEEVLDLIDSLSPYWATVRERFLASRMNLGVDRCSIDLSLVSQPINLAMKTWFYLTLPGSDAAVLLDILSLHLPMQDVACLEQYPDLLPKNEVEERNTPETWAQLLTYTPRVERLTLRSFHAVALCNLLVLKPTICPQLCTIHICDDHYLHGDRGEQACQLLVNVATARSEAGYPLRCLQLSDCYNSLPAELRDALRTRLHHDLETLGIRLEFTTGFVPDVE